MKLNYQLTGLGRQNKKVLKFSSIVFSRLKGTNLLYGDGINRVSGVEIVEIESGF